MSPSPIYVCVRLKRYLKPALLAGFRSAWPMRTFLAWLPIISQLPHVVHNYSELRQLPIHIAITRPRSSGSAGCSAFRWLPPFPLFRPLIRRDEYVCFLSCLTTYSPFLAISNAIFRGTHTVQYLLSLVYNFPSLYLFVQFQFYLLPTAYCKRHLIVLAKA